MRKIVAGIIGFMLFSIIKCEAKGLKVSPAEIILQDIIPGEFYNLGEVANVKITAYNDDDKENVFTIGCYKSYVVGKIMKGYTEIPDTEWISFDRREIKIAGKGKGHINVFLKIPGEEKYYNQNWCCYIGIVGKSEYGVSLGLYIRMRIETKEKEKILTQPYGEIAVVPSKVVFKKENVKKIKIYNISEKEVKIKIQPIEDIKEIRKYISSGYKNFPENCFLKFEDEISIPPNSKKEIPIKLVLNNKTLYGKFEKVFFLNYGRKTIFFRLRKEK